MRPQYITVQKSEILNDLEELSPNQRSVLVVLAETAVAKPQGQDFIARTNLSTASLKQAIYYLMKKDFIYRDTNGYYQVLDPAILAYLQGISVMLE